MELMSRLQWTTQLDFKTQITSLVLMLQNSVANVPNLANIPNLYRQTKTSAGQSDKITL